MEGDSSHHMMVDVPDSNVEDSASVSRKEASKKTLPWIEKYRPSTLHDLISHEEIVRTRASRFPVPCITPYHLCPVWIRSDPIFPGIEAPFHLTVSFPSWLCFPVVMIGEVCLIVSVSCSR